MSFAVQPEEWRSLADLKNKNKKACKLQLKTKVPLHDYVQLLPIQTIILRALFELFMPQWEHVAFDAKHIYQCSPTRSLETTTIVVLWEMLEEN